MLGGGKMWSAGKSYAASLWRSWIQPYGGVISVATDVYGGNNSNKFMAVMLDSVNGLMAWCPESGTAVDGNGNTYNPTIYYRSFKVSGGTFTLGGSFQSGPGNINLGVSSMYLCPLNASVVLACYSYGGGFAQYWSDFRAITVDTTNNAIGAIGNQATTSIAASRVNDICRLSDTLAVAAMEGANKLVILSVTGTTVTALEANVSPASVDSFYQVARVDNTHFATHCNTSGTHYLRIYAVSGNTITQVSSYTMNRSNQGVRFLTPFRFVTYWQSGNYYVADITVHPTTYALIEEPRMASQSPVAVWSIGNNSFTLDGQAIAQDQISGTQRQLRIVDLATDVWVGPWYNLNTVNADYNTTWGAWPIDATRILLHWTNAKHPAAATAFMQVMYR